jgi:hypothetical protein
VIVLWTNPESYLEWFENNFKHLYTEMNLCDHSSDMWESSYHKEGSVLNHTRLVLGEAIKDTDKVLLHIAALLHDIAKPRTDMGNGHFYGHDSMGSQMVEDIMKRLIFSKSEIERVKLLVQNHMFYYPHVEGESEGGEPALSVWSDSAVRRFLKRVGEENVEDLFKLRIADASSNPKSAFKPDEISKLQEHISKVRQEDMALKITDLEIDGNDLKEMGVQPGEKMGNILNSLLDMVIEDPLLNRKEDCFMLL